MIFYFTATGNSKYIAEKIAEKTNDRIINITQCVQEKEFNFTLNENESLGFIVPVYFYGVPMIVAEFLQKLNMSSQGEYYSYAIMNCGGSTGESGKLLKKIFDVDAIFGIATVDNYLPMFKMKSEEEVEERLDKADKELEIIIQQINNKQTGDMNKTKGAFSGLLTPVAYPIYKKGRKTSKFTVNEKCISCSLCEKICPRQVIRMEEGKPVWEKPQCELCLGCIQRCPTAAINYGKKTENHGRYINHRTKL